MNQSGPTRHRDPGRPNSYTTSRDTTLGFDRAEVRATYGAGLLEALVGEDRAFSFGPVAGGSGLTVMWQWMPSDLRAFVRTQADS